MLTTGRSKTSDSDGITKRNPSRWRMYLLLGIRKISYSGKIATKTPASYPLEEIQLSTVEHFVHCRSTSQSLILHTKDDS